MDVVAPVELAAPTRGRGLRLRCFEQAVELDYRAWRAERALPFLRTAMLASLISWSAFAAGSLAIGPHLSRLAVPGTLLVIVPLCTAGLLFTSVERLRPWVLHAGAGINILGGLTAVLILDRAGAAAGGAGYADLGTAAVALFVFYGCTILHLPPGLAVPAMAPYVLVQQLLVLHGFAAEPARRIGYSLVLWISVMSGLLLALALERVSRTTFHQERLIEAQQVALGQERERSERLLLGILPAEIAQRLKTHPGTIAESHDDVTVLFADVVGFTDLASRVTATELVSLLNEVFSRFDRLTAEHGVEKIKTIGDAYMAVAGLPSPREDHVEACADLALAMRTAAQSVAAGASHALDFRIGLHRGPVVAGVIGTTKFAYDLWGDTVNLAARMESHGVTGQIQVTDAVAVTLLERGYRLRERGVVDVKGRGGLPVWSLDAGPSGQAARGPQAAPLAMDRK